MPHLRPLSCPSTEKLHARLRIAAMLFMVLLFAVSCFSCVLLELSSASVVSVLNVGAGLFTMVGCFILFYISFLGSMEADFHVYFFELLVFLTFLGAGADNAACMLDGAPQLRGLHYILYLLSYPIVSFLVLIYWLYQEKLLFEHIRRPVWVRRFVLVLTLLDILVRCAAGLGGYLFLVDENGYLYSKGMDWLVVICPSIIFGLCIKELFWTNLSMRKRIPFLAFCSAPFLIVISLLLQVKLNLTYVVTFFSLLLMYGIIQVERSIELTENRRRLSELQMQVMLSQIKPHFLYNSLATVSYLCERQPQLARESISHLSTYLRANMDSLESNSPIPFDKELEHVENYLWIEQQRFSDSLTVKYDIQYRDFTLPALTLQPLVENAVRHGLSSREEGGWVKLSSFRRDGCFWVTVEDNGIGFDPLTPKKDGKPHIGISNVRSRLRMQSRAELMIDSTPGKGTTVTIRLPERKRR